MFILYTVIVLALILVALCVVVVVVIVVVVVVVVDLCESEWRCLLEIRTGLQEVFWEMEGNCLKIPFNQPNREQERR